jgi:hypothetical protein
MWEGVYSLSKPAEQLHVNKTSSMHPTKRSKMQSLKPTVAIALLEHFLTPHSASAMPNCSSRATTSSMRPPTEPTSASAGSMPCALQIPILLLHYQSYVVHSRTFKNPPSRLPHDIPAAPSQTACHSFARPRNFGARDHLLTSCPVLGQSGRRGPKRNLPGYSTPSKSTHGIKSHRNCSQSVRRTFKESHD